VASFPQFSPPKPCTHLSSPHTCYMPHPSHFSRFNHPNNMGCVVYTVYGRSHTHTHTHIYIHIYETWALPYIRATKFHTHTQQQLPFIPTKSNFYLPKPLATVFRNANPPTVLTPHFPISISILLSVSHFKLSVQVLSPLHSLATRQVPTASLQSTRSTPKLAGNPQGLTRYICSHSPVSWRRLHHPQPEDAPWRARRHITRVYMLMNKVMGSSSKARGPLLVQIGQVRGAAPKDK
jgi:hypothetical protein